LAQSIQDVKLENAKLEAEYKNNFQKMELIQNNHRFFMEQMERAIQNFKDQHQLSVKSVQETTQDILRLIQQMDCSR
jgi:hypothetical protein